MDDFSLDELVLNIASNNRVSYKNSSIMTQYQSQNIGTQMENNKKDQMVYNKFYFECQIEEINQQNIKPDYDQRRLQHFLNTIYPTVIQALEESQQLKKLQKFQPLSDVNRKDTEELYQLQNLAKKPTEIENKLEITDIQWNSNGLIIAASYGCLEHDGSCVHQSFVSAWSINSRTFNQDKPNYTIDLPCIMCLQFHPTKPNILAAGSFNGELYLLDITAQVEIAHSQIDDYFHRESITQILWLQDEQLLSLGCEGKILIWPADYEEILLKYPLKGCYMVRKKESSTESVGGITICQIYDDQTTFIIGSEGGSVLKAQITPINFNMTKKAFLDSRDKGLIWKEDAMLFMQNLNQKFLPEVKIQIENYCKERRVNQISIQTIISAKPDIRKMYVNPLSFAYEAHYGSVFSVNASPFIKNVFLTSSMDGQIRIYQTNNQRCLAIYEYIQTYILCAQFSPTRPCVFAACDSDGQILIFDLMQNQQQQAYIIPTIGKSATCLRFNQRQSDLLACSYSSGLIKIYQLNDELTLPQEGELKKFQYLIN
ncbi:hypothetical protein pb186bvf_015811 [Paramecium bursaria]